MANNNSSSKSNNKRRSERDEHAQCDHCVFIGDLDHHIHCRRRCRLHLHHHLRRVFKPLDIFSVRSRRHCVSRSSPLCSPHSRAPRSFPSFVFLGESEQDGEERERAGETTMTTTSTTTRTIILLKRKRNGSQAEIETQHQEKASTSLTA